MKNIPPSCAKYELPLDECDQSPKRGQYIQL